MRSNGLIQINSNPGGQMGIVSPCSTCKNQLAVSDPNKQTPMCPRRYWIDLAKSAQAQTSDNPIPTPPLYLTRSGTDDPQTLSNPVYSQQDSSVLIWVALVENNQGVQDESGNELTPDLLDPGFDTTYINCSLLPYIPCESQAQMYQSGAYKESQRLFVTPIENYQVPFGSDQTVQVSGFVRRVNFALNFSFLTPEDDTLTDGF